MDKTSNRTTEKETMARLYWQCRRGMLELDILLQSFVEKHYQTLSKKNQQVFRKLLTYADQELYEILVGNKEPGDREVANVTNKIRQAITD